MRGPAIFLCVALALASSMPAAAKSFWTSVPDSSGDVCGMSADTVPSDSYVPPPSGPSYADRKLLDANFANADLRGRDFRGAALYHANFAGADLTGAKFSGARICHTDFTAAKLARANFAGAKLSHDDFSRAKGEAADFSHATVLATDVPGSDFRDADFSGATIVCMNGMIESMCDDQTGFDLGGADLAGAILVGPGAATLDGASVEGATFATNQVPGLARTKFGRLFLAPDYMADRAAQPFSRGEILALAKTFATQMPVIAFGPGFDCARVATKIEHDICADPDLAALDEAVAEAYKVARAHDGEAAVAAQRAWLRRRDACKDDGCIQDSGLARLKAIMAEPGLATRPAPGNYVPASTYATVPSGVAGTRLGARFAALGTGTSDRLAVKGDTVSAQTFGGNGAVCDSSGKLTRIRNRSGWRADNDESGPTFAGFGSVIVLFEGEDYCGAHAHWDPIWKHAD